MIAIFFIFVSRGTSSMVCQLEFSLRATDLQLSQYIKSILTFSQLGKSKLTKNCHSQLSKISRHLFESTKFIFKKNMHAFQLLHLSENKNVENICDFISWELYPFMIMQFCINNICLKLCII